MTAALIILVAHGLDVLTFLMAVGRWGIGGESNPIAAAAFAAAGVGGIVILKATGASLAAGIVARTPRWQTGMLCLAAGAGIIGALSNLTALAM